MLEPVRIGDLNRRIVLQQPDRTDNGRGGSAKAWEDVATVWAQMIPLRGNEALSENLLRDNQLWKVTIRFNGSVTPDWRFTHGGREFNIRSAEDPDGRRHWTVMTAESGVRT